jgi:RNA polymerase sigma-70 factor (ECF subfamily)
LAVDIAPHFVPDPERSPGTLGEVLYANPSKALVSEAEWVSLVQCVAAGDQGALHALYERAHRVVFTLIMRITANRETAEEVTLDVFHDVWRRASRYQEAGGTVLGWIMNQARSRAIDRLRFDQRQKRVRTETGDPLPATGMADPGDLIAFKQQSQALRSALAILTPDERHAIEAAFFSELTYAEVATQLNQPLGTIKTRIRSGLHKLRQALDESGHRP